MPFTRRTTTALPAAEPENVPSTRQRRSSTILALAAATAATTASPEQENVAYYAPETPVQNDLQGAHRASLSNLRESAWTDEQLIEFVTKFEGFFNPGKSTKEKYKAFLVSDDAKELLAMRSGLTVKGLRSKLDSTKSKYQEAKGRLGVSGASRCLGGRGQLSEGLYAVLDGLWRHVPHCAVPASDIGSMAGGMAMEDDNGALTSLARVASEAAAATAAAAAATAAGVPLLLPPPRLAPVVAFAPPRTAAALAGTASAFAPPPPTAAIAPATQPAVRRKRRGGGKHPKQPKQPKQPRVLPDAVQRVGTHPLGLSGASSSSSIPPRLPNSGLMVAFRDETMSEESDDDDGSGYVYGEEGDTVVSDGGRGSSNIGRGSSSSSSSGSSNGSGCRNNSGNNSSRFFSGSSFSSTSSLCRAVRHQQPMLRRPLEPHRRRMATIRRSSISTSPHSPPSRERHGHHRCRDIIWRVPIK